MRIGLLGDVMLGRLVGRSVARGVPPAELWSAELRELCRSLDLVVVNLECCLSVRGARTHAIPGKPFFFRGPPSAVGALTTIGVGVASLANNHALDFGPDAAADTASLLAAHGIAAIGAGADRERARRPAVASAGGLRVGVLAATDHPVEYAAGDPGWGTAFADLRDGTPGWLLDDVAAVRRRCDAAIAFVHWGPNMTSEPAGWQLAVARELQEAGADLVAGHSSHVFHGIGRGAGGPVVFDLGGALDDYAVDASLRNDLGLLAIWQPGGEPALELAGLRIDHGRTRLAEGSDAEWVRDRLRAASAALGARVEPAPGGRLRLAG
jgi:poly-gamma-glutamate synthesis protein (capsule biosynthesis protein)